MRAGRGQGIAGALYGDKPMSKVETAIVTDASGNKYVVDGIGEIGICHTVRFDYSYPSYPVSSLSKALCMESFWAAVARRR